MDEPKREMPANFPASSGIVFDIRVGDEVGGQPGQGIAENQEFDASKPSLDGNRPAARHLNAAADQRGDVHGTAVDVKQLAFEAMLGEEALLLRHPEKRLGRVYRGVGDAQLVGCEDFVAKPKKKLANIGARRVIRMGLRLIMGLWIQRFGSAVKHLHCRDKADLVS